MVELVDDHDIEPRRVQLLHLPMERLNRREHVVPVLGPLTANEPLPEIIIAEDAPEHVLALFKDLVPMRNEEKPLESTARGAARSRRQRPKSCRSL